MENFLIYINRVSLDAMKMFDKLNNECCKLYEDCENIKLNENELLSNSDNLIIQNIITSSPINQEISMITSDKYNNSSNNELSMFSDYIIIDDEYKTD